MIQVDWWTWECARCDWKVVNQRTVNYQQSFAEALVRMHIQEHEKPVAAAPVLRGASDKDWDTDLAETRRANARDMADGPVDLGGLLCDVAQFLDAHRQDAESWTEWDESVRLRVTQAMRYLEAAVTSPAAAPNERWLQQDRQYFENDRVEWDAVYMRAAGLRLLAEIDRRRSASLASADVRAVAAQLELVAAKWRKQVTPRASRSYVDDVTLGQSDTLERCAEEVEKAAALLRSSTGSREAT